MTARRAVLAVGSLAALVASAALGAQSDPRLLEAIRLAQGGRQDSARAVVSRLLATLAPTDSVYPEALYAAGILGQDARTITTHLQRVVVEYGQSPWADDALLRLAQFHFAQNDPASTVQSAERLRRDYPDSPLRPRAAFWGARAYFALRDEASGCALIRETIAGAGDDVELRNQAEFYAARCATAGGPPAPDTARPLTGYSVQVLAVRNAQQVDDMLTRLRVMGFPARVVRDTSGFFKVRVGPYPTREEAERARSRLRTRLGGQPFVVSEP
ncbi:MAG TPA: SPOR domain-containing protein [Gemmatimonadales bacterium]|nr:SPOR domain-containing protein [Gemmatimonadales bacterium]